MADKHIRLSQKELSVAKCYLHGMNTTQVAEAHRHSPRTSQWHLYRIYKKLGITRMNQLRKALIKYGLIPFDPVSF